MTSPKKSSSAAQVKAELQSLATPERAVASRRFFKTGKGEYGEGDVFVGVGVPQQRKVAAQFKQLPLKEVEKLLCSPVHEERLVALFILVRQFERAPSEEVRTTIFELYLRRIERINNWDLVDSSAPQIVGGYLFDRDRKLLDELATSDHLWSRRIAMLATLHFIKKGESRDTLRLAELLLTDDQDLIHKASGWMLREMAEHVGLAPLRGFLGKHAAHMPRTMLRYAIEKLPDKERKSWLSAGK